MDMLGNCGWKPSAAMGYRDGGRALACIDGGTLLRDGSRKGEGTCGLVDIADCDGLALFWVVTGDCSPFARSGCCWAAACAAWAS